MTDKKSNKKAMTIMLICVIIFFGGIFLFKEFIFSMQKKFSKKFENPIVYVSAQETKISTWRGSMSVVGSTDAVQGVNVTTESAGLVTAVDFQSGQDVKKGQILVELDIAPDVAQLHQYMAQAALAKITYDRDKKQIQFGAVSQEQLDTDLATLQSDDAQVEQEKALISQKIIRAPFSGRLGISPINLGDYVASGASIVQLETLNPIYVNFYLPQQDVSDIKMGEDITITTDQNGEKFSGKVTAINPIVDVDVRNMEVQATINNPKEILLPGMFTHVEFQVGEPKKYITLPQMAISFNPYGSIVYILEKTNQMHDGKPVWKAEQQFVKTGESRGDQIAVTSGLKLAQMVVTSGQLKLRNDSLVVIDNSILPSDSANPAVKEQ